MSLIDKMRERKAGNRDFGNFFEADSVEVLGLPLWTIPSGKTKASFKIRILPPTKAMDEDPFVDFYAHYGLGTSKKQVMICTRKFYEGGCPICEAVDELKATDDSKHMQKVCDSIRAKKKALAHGLVDDKESYKDGPLVPCVLLLPSSVESGIIEVITGTEPDEDSEEEIEATPGLGDVTHYKSGRWLVIKRNPDAEVKNYYKVFGVKQKTPIAPSIKQIKEILKQRGDLQKLVESGIAPFETLEKEAARLLKVYGANVSRGRRPDEDDANDEADLQF